MEMSALPLFPYHHRAHYLFAAGICSVVGLCLLQHTAPVNMLETSFIYFVTDWRKYPFWQS